MTQKNTYCAQLVAATQSSHVLEQIALDGPSDEAHILKVCRGLLFFVIWKKRTPELMKPLLKYWGDCPVPLWLSLPLSFLRNSRSIPIIISGTVLSLFLHEPKFSLNDSMFINEESAKLGQQTHAAFTLR